MVEGLYYLYSENKGAYQLRGYRAADQRLSFRIHKNRFSHDMAHMVVFNAGKELQRAADILNISYC